MKTRLNPNNHRGFSLVVVVSIMILLSLIAVGLLSLSSVTIRTANDQAALKEAQANARLALTIAIGELQRLAGPDQRIIATANIAGDASGEILGASSQPQNNSSMDGTNKGLSPVQPGTRFWTGVFTHNDTSDQIYTKTPSASFAGWLVSNSSQSNGVDPGNTSFSANSDGTASDGTSGIVLVGNNTYGNQDVDSDNFVVAPLVNIYDKDGQTGSYAWWIGDEGSKSLINGSNQQTNGLEESFATLAPQRRGWEIVEGIQNYPEGSSADQDSLDQIVTLASSELLIGDNASLLTDNESLFHSATTFSQGLHTNVVEGGLKVDLTSALERNLASGPSSSSPIDNFPSARTAIIPSIATTLPLDLLTWDRLLPFYDRVKDTSPGEALTVGVDETASDGSIYATAPIVTEMRVVLGARVASEGRRGGTKATSCAKILFVLANPYPRPLRWNDDLELQLRSITPPEANSGSNRHTSRLWGGQEVMAESAFFPWDESEDSSGSEPAVFNQAVFKVGASSLAPGEARVYTMGSAVKRSRSSGTSRQEINLVASTANLDDFNNCLELESIIDKTLPITLDIREQTNTCLLQLEMRLGRNTSLRRISGFEFNNTDWSATRKTWTQAISAPVPLVLYRFQISQPGVDYVSRLPGSGISGQRASALRTFADFNLQATNIESPITSYTPPPYFFENIDRASDLGSTEPNSSGETGPGFQEGLFAEPLPWGYSNVTGSDQTVLFSIPSALSSLAQLQHLDLTVDDTKVSIGHQPGYAVGNSYATPLVKRALTEQARFDYLVTGFNAGKFSSRSYYDISYLLNASLWDRYFFSTFDGSQDLPINPNQILTSDISSSNAEAASVAASIVNSGMFNVNSTSISAWKAFLASSRDFLPTGSGAKNTFPRSLQQPNEGESPPTGAGKDSFGGSRVLSDAEIDSLARAIVRQVRLRGPFTSMAHFVNRNLADVSAEPELTRSGALQAALDQTVNIDIEGNNNPFSQVSLSEDRAAFAFNGGAPAPTRPGTATSPPPNADSEQDWATSSSDRNYKSLSSIVADRSLATGRNSGNEFGYRSTSIPAWVNQADVLQLLGSSMNVRSDTFSIRTCGRSQDSNGKILAVAYAEAIVQRGTDFVDPENTSDDDLTELNQINQNFGRRFRIVSFNWLSKNQI